MPSCGCRTWLTWTASVRPGPGHPAASITLLTPLLLHGLLPDRAVPRRASLQAALAEISRVLAPGGVFVASTFLTASAPLGQVLGDDLVRPLSQVRRLWVGVGEGGRRGSGSGRGRGGGRGRGRWRGRGRGRGRGRRLGASHFESTGVCAAWWLA